MSAAPEVAATPDRRAVTIVDVEQLGGVLVEQLASLFEEEPKRVAKVRGLLSAPPTVQQSAPKAISLKAVREAVG
jgi:cobaltochelatase CobT